MADYIVRSTEAPAVIGLDQSFHPSVGMHAREAAPLAFTHDQPALQVKGRAVAALRAPDQLRGPPRRHAKSLFWRMSTKNQCPSGCQRGPSVNMNPVARRSASQLSNTSGKSDRGI